MRTLSATLAAAQLTDRTPYFDLKFYRGASLIGDYSCSGAPTDNTAKLKYLKMNEFQYSSGGNGSETTILLNDTDRSIPDLRGCSVDIGIGDVTTEGNETAEYPRMWVKHQRLHSYPGNATVELTLEGWAEALDEEHARADNFITDPALYYLWERDTTVYAIMAAILHADVSYVPFVLDALGVDDGIINTFQPYFELNSERNRYESKLDILTRLLYMTKCYMRPLADNHLELVYPQTTDSTDLTIYSDTIPWFYEFNELKNELIPNSIIVFCDNSEMDINYSWPNLKLGQSTDADAVTRYNSTNVYGLYQAPTITVQGDADNRADAILARIKAETVSQALVIPHHCGIQLYDYLLVKDKRGRLAYEDCKVRVTGLTHTFLRDNDLFRLSIYGGGLVNFPMYSDEQLLNMKTDEQLQSIERHTPRLKGRGAKL